MADTKLSDIAAAIATLDDSDLLYAVDVSDTTDDPGGSTKKMVASKV